MTCVKFDLISAFRLWTNSEKCLSFSIGSHLSIICFTHISERNNMKTLHMSVLVAITILFSSVALADPKEFKDADVNADGFLDSAEFANCGVEEPFKEFDGDGDGKVSKEEYEEKLQECE